MLFLQDLRNLLRPHLLWIENRFLLRADKIPSAEGLAADAAGLHPAMPALAREQRHPCQRFELDDSPEQLADFRMVLHQPLLDDPLDRVLEAGGEEAGPAVRLHQHLSQPGKESQIQRRIQERFRD